MAKSGYFEVADSLCRFRGIGHFLGESATFFSTLCTLKIRGISKRVLEFDRDPLPIRKISENDKIATFDRLSGTFSDNKHLFHTSFCSTHPTQTQPII